MESIKILDLFAGTQSVKKALFPIIQRNSWDKAAYLDYKGIDIYSPEGKNIILDLSQDDIICKLTEKLGNWKPDFIWASPICNFFSIATCVKNGNIYFETTNDQLKIRENWNITYNGVDYINQPDMIKRNIERAKFSLKIFENTKKIIEYFNVPFAIENPTTAFSRYILQEYWWNKCDYCVYGFDYKKPTTIYSNKRIILKRCTHKTHKRVIAKFGKGQQGISNYADRARVPNELIQDVFKQLMEVN